MITQDKANTLAADWIEAWNRHDIDDILSHYSEDVVFTSPFVVKLLGDNSGTIFGKEALESYFLKGLESYPDLKFEIINILYGVDSFTLYYKSVNEMLAAEVMKLDSNGMIERVVTHYR